MSRPSFAPLTRTVVDLVVDTAAWLDAHRPSLSTLAALCLIAVLPELLAAQNVGLAMNTAMNTFGSPIATAAALARFVLLALALWGVGKAAVDAIGGDGAAFGKAAAAGFALIMVYSPLWLLNNVLGLAFTPFPRPFCTVAAIALCPTNSFL